MRTHFLGYSNHVRDVYPLTGPTVRIIKGPALYAEYAPQSNQ
jgi:hypothetical protein